jgi:hypothetical protein
MTKTKTATGKKLVSVVVNPFGPQHAYLTEDRDQVWAVDMATKKHIPFGPPMKDVNAIAYGPDGMLIVASNSAIVALDQDGQVVARAPIPSPADALVYDSSGEFKGTPGRVYAVSQSAGRIFGFDKRLAFVVNTPFPPGAAAGAAVATDPTDGSVLLQSHGTITRVSGLGGRDVQTSSTRLAGAATPKGLHVGDDGSIYVTDGGVVRAFARSGEARRNDPFDGLPAGPSFNILRDATNYDPAVHTGPEWQEVLPVQPLVPPPPPQDSVVPPGVLEGSEAWLNIRGLG